MAAKLLQIFGICKNLIKKNRKIAHFERFFLHSAFRPFAIRLYFFFTPCHSSTVLVEMVVVFLTESADWTQVAVVEIVRHALQLVMPSATAQQVSNAKTIVSMIL